MGQASRARTFSFGSIVLLIGACLIFTFPAYSHDSEVPVIDVLLVYTPAAMQEERAVPPARELVDEADRVLLNSNARARIRLAGVAKVAYVEQPINDAYHLQLTLDRLIDPQDGYLDEVHALRVQHNADVVVLLATGIIGPEGFWAPLRPDAAHGFGVLTTTRDFAFTRLIGRVLGCEAQRGPLEETLRVIGDGAFVDSHAFVNTNWQNHRHSTVMGVRHYLLPFFSNPEVICFGARLGIAGAADNVRAINLIAPEIAAFRGTNNIVNPPQVEWQSPLGGASFLPDSNISLEVVASPIGAIQNVEFYQARTYDEVG